MRFSGHINIPKVDIEAYILAHKETLEILSRQAARKFVRAAISKIPIVTGMARGSYLNIGRFLRVAIPLTGKKRYRTRTRNGRTWQEKITRWYYPPGSKSRIPKTPESGAKLTAFKMEMLDTGNKIAFIFQINSRVFHYTLQDEMHVRSPSSPWQSMRDGRNAWLEYLRANLKKRLPKLKDYTNVTTISFGRGSANISQKYGRLRIRATEGPE